MRLDYTSCNILRTIISHQNITINDLCSQLNIPRRNFYYRLDKINDWLINNKFQPVNNNRSKGLTIDLLDSNKTLSVLNLIETPNYELSKDERISQIIILLVITNKPIFIDNFNKINQVSRNTTLSDISFLNEKYNDIVKFKKKLGYYLNLTILKQRLLVFQTIQSRLKFKTNFINQLLLQEIGTVFNNDLTTIENKIRAEILFAEQQLKRQFTDKDRRLLRYMFMISYLHIRYNKEELKFNEQQQYYLTNQIEWTTVQIIQKRFIKNFEHNLPNSEQLFISLLLSIIKSHQFQEKYTRKDVRLVRNIRLLIAEFQRIAGIYFIDKKGLEKQLFIHLKPAIQRGLFEIHIDNALRDDIQQNYPQIVNITHRAIKIIEEEYQFKFNDDELGYIAISFAAWLNKAKETKEKHLLLITEGGITSTTILEHQLRKLTIIPLCIHISSVSEYLVNKPSNEIELVITTTELPENENNNIPIIKVKHILNDREQLQIRHILENRDYQSQIPILVNTLFDEIQSYIPVNELANIKMKFDNIIRHNITLIGLPGNLNLSLSDSLFEHIHISRQKMNWQQAIDLVGQPLLEKGIIQTNYLQEIKDNIDHFGMYMYLTPQVALLHASPLEEQRKPFLSLLKVTKPIPFMIGHQAAAASLIFLLVPEKSGSHIQLLEQLNHILSNDVLLEKLLKATHPEQIKQIFIQL